LENLNRLYEECKKKLNSDTLKSLHYLNNTTSNEHKCIAIRMDIQLGYIYRYDEKWLQQKLDIFLKIENIKNENFNGLLGEIRTYGELLELKTSVQMVSSIGTPSSGSDFIVLLNNEKINIEVNTPQKTGSKTTTIEISKSITELINHTMGLAVSSNAPYGYPAREKDNIQYEAVSKFSKIKSEKEGKQFKKDEISILWLDLNDPIIFMFNQLEYTTPISSFNGAISSGFIWNAFYSLKGDNIYSNYNTFSKDLIKMEFDGRFNDSYIDFVVMDFFTHKVIFENHNSKKKIPSDLYKVFFHLHNLNNQNSYLSFGNQSNLKHKINLEREMSNTIIDL